MPRDPAKEVAKSGSSTPEHDSPAPNTIQSHQRDEPVSGPRRSRRIQEATMESLPAQAEASSPSVQVGVGSVSAQVDLGSVTAPPGADSTSSTPPPSDREEEMEDFKPGSRDLKRPSRDGTKNSKIVWYRTVVGAPPRIAPMGHRRTWMTVLSEVDPTSRWEWTDPLIQNIWPALINLVNSFAAGFFSDRLRGSLAPDARTQLERWTPNLDAYMTSTKPLEHLIIARTWHTLDEMLFSASFEERWKGGPWAHFGAMRDSLQCRSKKRLCPPGRPANHGETENYGMPGCRSAMNATYEMWASLSATIMDRAVAVTAAETKRIAARLSRDIGELVDLSADGLALLEAEMMGIAACALESESRLTRSSNKFWLAWDPTCPTGTDRGTETRLYGFPMSMEEKGWYDQPRLFSILWLPMQDRKHSTMDTRMVDLVMVPALMKDSISKTSEEYHCVYPLEVTVDHDHGHGTKEGLGEK